MTDFSIYVMQSGQCKKIGITGDAGKRKAQLQTGNPELVSLQIVSKAISKKIANRIEQRAHKLLSRFKRRGEWFDCDLIQVVDALYEAVSEWRFSLGLRSEADIDSFFDLERAR